jgi:hypothetical protein
VQLGRDGRLKDSAFSAASSRLAEFKEDIQIARSEFWESKAATQSDDSNNEVTASGGGEQIDDILDGLVGAVICGFESAVWAMLRVWSVMEAAVGKWSAQPFVEEQK